MFRLRSILTLLLLLATVSSLGAASLWPFGNRARERPAAEQTERSREHFEKGQSARAAGHLRRAARQYRTVWREYPGSDYASEALFQYGEICYERKEWKDAFGAFQSLLQRYPDYPAFDQVVLYQFNIALAAADGDGIRWLWVIPFRAWERSIAYFEILINNAPYSDLAPLALANISLIHQHLGNTAEAVDALDRLINLYPASLLADEAYLELGNTFADLNDGPLYDQGSTREAMSYYEDFLVLFPAHPKVGEAEEGLTETMDTYAKSKLVLGEYYYHFRNWYRAAEIFFNEAITIAPDSPSAAKARAYLNRIEEFKALAAADPDYRPPYTTWTDRLLFWRERRTDLREEDARAAAQAIDDAEAADSPGISSPVRE